VIFIILRQNISELGYLPSIGKSLPLANRGSKACFNFAAACASFTIRSLSWRLRPEAEKIAAPVPQHLAVNLIAPKVHEHHLIVTLARGRGPPSVRQAIGRQDDDSPGPWRVCHEEVS
jgi:hypothetical protein